MPSAPALWPTEWAKAGGRSGSRSDYRVSATPSPVVTEHSHMRTDSYSWPACESGRYVLMGVLIGGTLPRPWLARLQGGTAQANSANPNRANTFRSGCCGRDQSSLTPERWL